MRVVFLGSADFGIPALDLLHEKCTLAGVVATPPRKSGRGLKFIESPVARHVRTLADIPVLTPERLDDSSFVAALRKLSADCFVVVAYRILPREVFSLPELGTLNIHASLLPAYRGPAPIQRAIEAGERETGITIFRIDEGIDTGEILRQKAVAIGAEETTPELYGRLSLLGAETLALTLDEIQKGECTPQTQDHSRACKAPKLKKHESIIDWSLTAQEIFNKIRAFKPFPGTATMTGTGRLGIEWGVPVTETSSRKSCGSVVAVHPDSFDVQTGNGLFRVRVVKPEGRKAMAAADYLRGTILREGMQFNE
ncbi:MAG: methionyl-tRNA formyltransferase [Chitinispirillaceae bacterium]|nr:methionyl-tRNA formyltransferase [Chitinispirillaceae bacterium]